MNRYFSIIFAVIFASIMLVIALLFRTFCNSDLGCLLPNLLFSFPGLLMAKIFKTTFSTSTLFVMNFIAFLLIGFVLGLLIHWIIKKKKND